MDDGDDFSGSGLAFFDAIAHEAFEFGNRSHAPAERGDCILVECGFVEWLGFLCRFIRTMSTEAHGCPCFVYWSTQSLTVLYQSREFCGLSTQWPSSGK